MVGRAAWAVERVRGQVVRLGRRRVERVVARGCRTVACD